MTKEMNTKRKRMTWTTMKRQQMRILVLNRMPTESNV